MKDANTIALLKKLAPRLRRGDKAKVSEITKLSRDYVGKVLNPNTSFYHVGVIAAIKKVVGEREKKERSELSGLAKTLDQ